MNTNKKNVSVSIQLLKSKILKNGKHPVRLRIIHDRTSKYYTVKKESFTQTEFETIYNNKTRGQNKLFRLKFDAIETRALQIIDNLQYFSFESFEREYLNRKVKKTTIEAYFEEKAQELLEFDKFQTASGYKSSYRAILMYESKPSFQKITPKFLKGFEKFMIEEGKSYATIGIYLRNLRHIFNRAINDGIIVDYPFSRNTDTNKNKYSIPQGKNTKKALSLSDIKKLLEYKPESYNEAYYLKYWLFSYFCNGMNMADILNLKYKNVDEDTLTFIRQKTKDISNTIPHISVFLLPQAKEIIEDIGDKDKDLDRYIFPVYNSSQSKYEQLMKLKQHIKQTNKYVRLIASKTGIDTAITTYWARHSYSTILRDTGSSIEYIAEQLGHQSTKVTQSYLDSFSIKQKREQQAKLIPDYKA